MHSRSGAVPGIDGSAQVVLRVKTSADNPRKNRFFQFLDSKPSAARFLSYMVHGAKLETLIQIVIIKIRELLT